MNKTKNLLPVNLQGDKNIEALCEAIDKVFAIEEEVDNLLIYLIDKVNPSALDLLAWQFHIENYELVQTETEKRNIIKKSIELHRYKGTAWAINEAIKSFGYKDVEIEEQMPDVKYDGQYYYAGTEDYMGGVRWALFKVLIDIGESKSLSASNIQRLVALIKKYKNVRSHLKDITFKSTVEDYFDSLADLFSSILSYTQEDIKPWGVRYDGSIFYNQATEKTYNGSLKHDAVAKYDRWSGIKHDNEWDLMDVTDIDLLQADEINIIPFYDGKLFYSGFKYGSDAPFAIDASMFIRIIKHINYNGKYNYGGIYYNNSFRYDSSKSYFGGIFYKGNIETQEAVV